MLYDVLNVPVSASDDEIRKAYKRLALVHHPDRGGGDASSEAFVAIHNAYTTLTDPSKRRVYDAQLHGNPRTAVQFPLLLALNTGPRSPWLHVRVCVCGLLKVQAKQAWSEEAQRLAEELRVRAEQERRKREEERQRRLREEEEREKERLRLEAEVRSCIQMKLTRARTFQKHVHALTLPSFKAMFSRLNILPHPLVVCFMSVRVCRGTGSVRALVALYVRQTLVRTRTHACRKSLVCGRS
jgi:curved DNA-binding protein CbpA